MHHIASCAFLKMLQSATTSLDCEFSPRLVGEHRLRGRRNTNLRRQHLIDDAVVLRLLRRHEEVAVAVVLDLVHGLARVVGDVFAEQRAEERAEELPGVERRVAL